MGSCQASLYTKRELAFGGLPAIGEIVADRILDGQNTYPINFPQVDPRVPMELHA